MANRLTISAIIAKFSSKFAYWRDGKCN